MLGNTELSLHCPEELSPTGQPEQRSTEEAERLDEAKPTFLLSFLFSPLSQRSLVYLINQVASPRTGGLIPLSVIPQEKSCRDIPWRWNHRTLVQARVSGRGETKFK